MLACGRPVTRDASAAQETAPHLIEEDASKVFPVRKDVCLARQVCSTRVHQVQAGQLTRLSNLLQTQVLLWTVNPAGGRRVQVNTKHKVVWFTFIHTRHAHQVPSMHDCKGSVLTDCEHVVGDHGTSWMPAVLHASASSHPVSLTVSLARPGCG